MQELDATHVLRVVSPVTSSLAPWLPAQSHSQHQQRTALSRRQGAAIVISERSEFRIGKYPSKDAERDISHLPPCREVSSCLSDHRAGHPQRAEALGQVTATSLSTHTLRPCGSCCFGEGEQHWAWAVPALPRQSFPQDSSKTSQGQRW